MTPEDRTLGELGRAVDKLSGTVERLDDHLRTLHERYVPRETWEIAQGSNRIDISTVLKAVEELEKKLENEQRDSKAQIAKIRKESEDRFRANVRLTVTSIVAPVIVGIMLALLLSGYGR